jgi:hypothetical protein
MELVTIITVMMFPDVPDIRQDVGQYTFQTVEECERKLFDWYRANGGEIIRRSNGEIIYNISNYFRTCTVIQFDEANLK